MRILKTMRKQSALLWAMDESAPLNKNGQPQQAAEPAELLVRWESGGEEQVDKDGETFRPKATVYVGQDVRIGDWLWQGGLADWNAVKDSLPSHKDLPMSGEVARFDKIPTLRKPLTEFLRIAYIK